jgi:predicted dehydrogenase
MSIARSVFSGPAPSAREGRLRFAVVGIGAISGAHLAGLAGSASAEVAAVCEIDPDRAARAAVETGAQSFDPVDAVLADPEIAAVDLELPHDQHLEMASRALRAGKHVLLEKPLAPSERECLAIDALAKANAVIIGVAENTPFIDAYVAASRLVRDRALGAPRLIRTLISGSSFLKFSNTGHWKTKVAHCIGGGIYDAGPHSFFLLRWLFGDSSHVQAVANRLIESKGKTTPW